MFSPLSVCYFASLLVGLVCYSVRLSVCLRQSPAGHIFTPIFMQLHHLVDVVTSWKPVGFEVNGSKGQGHMHPQFPADFT